MLMTKENNNWGEVYERISWWDSQKIEQAKVMVVGAGALGNEVLKNLALLNIGYLLIVDFDTIEYSNLSRSVLFRASDCGENKAATAARRLKEINPNVHIEYIHGDIAFDVGLGIFRRMDMVVGCLDNRLARLYINRHCYKTDKIWVEGAIENLTGQLNVFKPNLTCYECQLKEEEFKVIQFREGCTDVAQRNANFGKIPTTPISASIIGALQVQEALKVINSNSGESLAGRRFFFDGMHNMFLHYNAPALKEYCLSHESLGTLIEADDLSCRMRLGDVLDWLEQHFGTTNIRIKLDYDVILELCGEVSEVSVSVLLPKFRLSNALVRQYQKSPGETVMISEKTAVLDRSFPNQETTMEELGIPPLQILKVETSDDIFSVELSGDKNFMDLGRKISAVL